jgi:hypothetical protein
MGHLRSFLENLHLEACSTVNARRGGGLPISWGKAAKYLFEEQVLIKKEEELVTSLYALVSDTDVQSTPSVQSNDPVLFWGVLIDL